MDCCEAVEPGGKARCAFERGHYGPHSWESDADAREARPWHPAMLWSRGRTDPATGRVR